MFQELQGSIGITLAGGADYESKEITVSSVHVVTIRILKGECQFDHFYEYYIIEIGSYETSHNIKSSKLKT